MRTELTRFLHGCTDERIVVLSGDLGFQTFEELQTRLGNRFINAGVAEQNMISMAAGLAKDGLRPWVYSIAPFLYARGLEQIRNDVSLPRLPVVLTGNGGGYGYGVQGPTHHALEDYGTLSMLAMDIFVPVCNRDVEIACYRAAHADTPCYIRLGRSEWPRDVPDPQGEAVRKLLNGDAGVLVVVGPLAGAYLARLAANAPQRRPALWNIWQLPLRADMLPGPFLREVDQSVVSVVEEHVGTGGCGQQLAAALLLQGARIKAFRHFFAAGYPSGTFGSQYFHRLQSRIDADSVLEVLIGDLE